MCYGIVYAVQCVFVVNPNLYSKWYGLAVTGLTALTAGLEHFMWGLEYYFSSSSLQVTTILEI